MVFIPFNSSNLLTESIFNSTVKYRIQAAPEFVVPERGNLRHPGKNKIFLWIDKKFGLEITIPFISARRFGANSTSLKRNQSKTQPHGFSWFSAHTFSFMIEPDHLIGGHRFDGFPAED